MNHIFFAPGKESVHVRMVGKKGSGAAGRQNMAVLLRYGGGKREGLVMRTWGRADHMGEARQHTTVTVLNGPEPRPWRRLDALNINIASHLHLGIVVELSTLADITPNWRKLIE